MRYLLTCFLIILFAAPGLTKSNVICIDVEKVEQLLPSLLIQVASNKCCGTAPSPPPVSGKPVKLLTGYLWENSDNDPNDPIFGKAILLPHASLTGKIIKATVNDEVLSLHSIYSGREVLAATQNMANYGKATLTVETESSIYKSVTKPPVIHPPEAKEKGLYWGRHNGNRPTWYFNNPMSEYPQSFTVVLIGCSTTLVTGNNGHRFVSGPVIVKQSDVSGRGLAVVGSAFCKSKTAYVEY